MPQVAAAPTPPSSRPSLISTDIDFDRPGLQSGHLRLPYSHDRSGYGHIQVPIAVLNQGVIVDEGLTDEVLRRPTHAYTKELLANVPTLE